MNKFNPMKARVRASFAAGSTEEPRLEKIDKENEVLHGVQITLEGEARGHGVWLDREFCEAVAEAGNAMGEAGVKVRFGHPAMCSDALGTYLGRARNFRVVDLTRKETGEKAAGVLADIHIMPESHSAPSGDLGKWVMEAAENSPDTFGQSIVFTYADLKSTNEDGDPILRSEFDSDYDFDKARGENKVFAVLGKLHGTDFTDTPAATDGVFSSNDLAAEAEEMLAEHPEILSTISQKPEKVIEFLDRMGLLTVLETKRVAGIQAAKDKELAAAEERHKAAMAEQTDRHAAALAKIEADHQAEMAAKCKEVAAATADAVRAESATTIESLNADIAEKAQALDAAKADVEQLRAKVSEAEKVLAETRAALAAETERYREQIGLALQQPAGVPAAKGADLIRCSFAGAGK